MGYRGILVLACLFAGSASAATINVPADQATIQAAIDAASDGDVVLVAPGTYYEQIDFKGKAITVKSSRGAAATILDGNNGGPIVTFDTNESTASVLQGFTLTHAHYSTTSKSGAISIISASPTIEDNVFMDNTDSVGTGVSASAISASASSAIIVRNYFVDNVGLGDGNPAVVSFVTGSHVVADNVFANNSAVTVQELTGPGAPQINNNTMVGNSIGLGIEDFGPDPNPPGAFSNNLIAFNKIGVAISKDVDLNLPFSDNLVYGNTMIDYEGVSDQTGSDGNISADPKLKDWADGDVHLLYGSPAIDSGGSAVSQVSAMDFYGNTRVAAAVPGGTPVVDIGAAEYQPPSASDGSLSTVADRAVYKELRLANGYPGEALDLHVQTRPLHGAITVSESDVRYAPAAGYVGADSFTFTLTDPYGAVSNVATESISVVDIPARIIDTRLSLIVVRRQWGMLMVHKAYREQTLSYTLVSGPQHGTVVIANKSGAYLYTPNRGFPGQDSFSVQARDQYGMESNVATVSITAIP